VAQQMKRMAVKWTRLMIHDDSVQKVTCYPAFTLAYACMRSLCRFILKKESLASQAVWSAEEQRTPGAKAAQELNALTQALRCLTRCLASVQRHFDGGTGPLAECSTEKSSTKVRRIVLVPAALISGMPAASGLPINRASASLMARRAAKCSLTSIFLMRLIATPIVWLPAWTVLVWSEGWRAEGENRKIEPALPAYTQSGYRAGVLRSTVGA